MPDNAQQRRESLWSRVGLGGRLLGYVAIAVGLVILAMILNSPELNSPEPKRSATTTPSVTTAQAPAPEPNPSAPAPAQASAPPPSPSPPPAPATPAPATSPAPVPQTATAPAPSPAPAPVAQAPASRPPPAQASALPPSPSPPPTATTAPNDAEAAATNVRKSNRYSHSTEAVIPSAAVGKQSPPVSIETPPKPAKEASGAKALRPTSESVAAAATPAKASRQFPSPLLGALGDLFRGFGALALSAEQSIDSAAVGRTGWAVQLGAQRSEAEAKSHRTRLTAKYASALNGSTISERKAIVNGETVYRLRVVDLSKAGAEALCTRLKVEGADCFIVK